MLGDQWSLVILRDIAIYIRRSFRELRGANDEGISAPVLARRLTDLTTAGFLTKAETSPGKQGRYSLTELGLQTIPLMRELARLGKLIDPATAEHRPEFTKSSEKADLETTMAQLREEQNIGA